MHTTLEALDLVAFLVWAVTLLWFVCGERFVPHSHHGCYVGVCECGDMLKR